MTEEEFRARCHPGTVKQDAGSMDYKVYVPPGDPPKSGWPVVLFLHGLRERGSDGWAQTTVGIGPAIQRHPERFPCLVVFPQCLGGADPPEGPSWYDRDKQDPALKALNDVLDGQLENVPKEIIDRSRVYLTGISMGASGAWEIAARNPKTFAALMLACPGVGGPARVAQLTGQAAELQPLPIWIFQGAADQPASRVINTGHMVNALVEAGNQNVGYTLYRHEGHNCWDQAYGDESVISCLLAQHR